MLRSFCSLLLLPALAACATTATPEPQFVMLDTGLYKTPQEKQRAELIAQNDCKVKALSASATIEKSIISEKSSHENLERAREKSGEMYTSSYTLCMLNAGFTQR